MINFLEPINLEMYVVENYKSDMSKSTDQLITKK